MTDIVSYYNEAKKLIEVAEFSDTDEARQISIALDLDSGEDRPDVWIAEIQKILISGYVKYNNSDFAENILYLYNKGVELESKRSNAMNITFLLLGFILGASVSWVFLS